jgi:ABC-type glycerol-3-phosphate transport system permease component
VITYALLIIAAAFFLVPMYWIFITAVKPKEELFTIPVVWWPSRFIWRNFYEVWVEKAPFTRYLLNTTFIAVFNVIGQTASAAIVGYGFAVGRFRGRNFLFILVLATMMIPPQVTLIPLFVIFRYLKWIDTFWPLIVPGFFGVGVGGAFYIFLMRQFFMAIPLELAEAAEIDGANAWRILWNVYLPNSIPAVTAVGIFSFIHAWNDFLAPLIYLHSKDKWTLNLGLAGMRENINYYDYNSQMAGAFLISLVPIVVFFLAQRYFTEGITMTGLKG